MSENNKEISKIVDRIAITMIIPLGPKCQWLCECCRSGGTSFGKVTSQNLGLAALELSIENVHGQQNCP